LMYKCKSTWAFYFSSSRYIKRSTVWAIDSLLAWGILSAFSCPVPSWEPENSYFSIHEPSES
jgi:hypothetical protein